MGLFIIVRADWDPEAKVFVATSDDIGIATEAASIEGLREKLPVMIADLLEEERTPTRRGLTVTG